MIYYKKLGAVIALVLVAAVCCACTCAKTTVEPTAGITAVKNGSIAVDPGAASALQLSHTAIELPLDGTLGILHPYNIQSPDQLQWSVEDSTVAEISKGIVTPVSAGTTIVTCTDGENTTSCKVIVNPDFNMDYSLQIWKTALTLKVGDTGQVEYAYTGSGAVAVFSSDSQVLKVENGCYTALSPGTAVITCTDGIRQSQCVVTVTESSSTA